jgi:hypothetical protein
MVTKFREQMFDFINQKIELENKHEYEVGRRLTSEGKYHYAVLPVYREIKLKVPGVSIAAGLE